MTAYLLGLLMAAVCTSSVLAQEDDCPFLTIVQSHFQKVFPRLDHNKDGFMDQEEFTAITTSFDLDGDGYYSWDEFSSTALAAKGKGEGEFETFGRSAIMVAHEKTAFGQLACTYGEVDRVPVTIQITDLQTWFDADADGKISEEEFMNYHIRTFEEDLSGRVKKCPK